MDWQPIETAPKDGSEIQIRVVHPNAKYSKDPEGEGWIMWCRAHWIDHNGGGFTWHGPLGEITHWMPLDREPKAGE